MNVKIKKLYNRIQMLIKQLFHSNEQITNLYCWRGLGDYDYLCEFSINIKHEYFEDICIPKFNDKYYVFLSMKRMTYAIPFSISLIFGPQYNSDSPVGEKIDCEYDLRNFILEEFKM